MESDRSDQRLENSLEVRSPRVLALLDDVEGLLTSVDSALVRLEALHIVEEFDVFLLAVGVELLHLGDVVSDEDVLHLLGVHLVLSLSKEALHLSLVLVSLELVAEAVLGGLAHEEGLEVDADLPLLDELFDFFGFLPGGDDELGGPPGEVGTSGGVEEVIGVGVLDYILVEDCFLPVPNELFVVTVIDHGQVGVRRVREHRLSLQIVVNVLLISVLVGNEAGGAHNGALLWHERLHTLVIVSPVELLVIRVEELVGVLLNSLVETGEHVGLVSLSLVARGNLVHSELKTSLEGLGSVTHMLVLSVNVSLVHSGTLAAGNSVLVDAPDVANSVFKTLIIEVPEEQGGRHSPEDYVLCLELEGGCTRSRDERMMEHLRVLRVRRATSLRPNAAMEVMIP